VREPEGIESPRPGRSAKTPWSKGHDLDIRNVEAVGSNPITSTEAQVNGLKWIPVASKSTHERYVGIVVMVVARRGAISENPAHEVGRLLFEPRDRKGHRCLSVFIDDRTPS
jgi:hypothetical protein